MSDDQNTSTSTATANAPALKVYSIVAPRDEKIIYEVMARDEEHAEELYDEGEAEEVHSDVKWCEVVGVYEEGAEDVDEEDEVERRTAGRRDELVDQRRLTLLTAVFLGRQDTRGNRSFSDVHDEFTEVLVTSKNMQQIVNRWIVPERIIDDQPCGIVCVAMLHKMRVH